MIVATAGHVDHGKTALVRALTGVDTDRTAEERRRGMSIDLGFAYADLGTGVVGFVDVPGHERFIRNMLAGVACVDLALLVVAADDGPMPQTHEHLDILRLLHVARLAVVLTKTDLVEPGRLAQVRREVDALAAAHGWQDAPCFPVCAPRGEGLGALSDFLRGLARPASSAEDAAGFRMAIDRSFVLAGAGWVATGAVLSGTCRVGDKLILQPQGIPVRIRSLHANNASAQWARVGERCAVNLVAHDLKRAGPGRGDWLVHRGAQAASARIDVRLEMLASANAPLRDNAKVHLHLGAAVRQARVVLLEGGPAQAGSVCFAQLLLDKPAATTHGERFILRDGPLHRTIAGGSVLDPAGPARQRRSAGHLAALAAMTHSSPREALARHLVLEPDGFSLRHFAAARNLLDPEIARLCALADLVVLEPAGLLVARRPRLESARRALLEGMGKWHEANPSSLGPTPAQAALFAGVRASSALFAALLRELQHGPVLVRRGFRLALAAHRPHLTHADAAMLETLTSALRANGMQPPVVGELAERAGIGQLQVQAFLQQAVATGHLLLVAPNRCFLAETVDALAAVAAQLAGAGGGKFSTAAFRDSSGLGRNVAVEVLEFFDRRGITRFDGASRSMAHSGSFHG